jgi:hypothetical protein
VTAPHWKDLGFLTPDAPECQQDVWALMGRTQTQLAAALDELALRTAEPTWAASLADLAGRARTLGRDLLQEAGEPAQERLASDEAMIEFEGPLEEVLGSGHVPSLIVTAYAVLGELGTLPARLLEDLAGVYSRPICARILATDSHRSLARLFLATDPAPQDRDNLRRLLRHLNGRLFVVYATWRQTFHVLGVDGESLEEESRNTARVAAEALGLKVTAADLAVFRA